MRACEVRLTPGEEKYSMVRDRKYIVYVSLAIGAFLVLRLLSPRQRDWRVTYAPDDKNPYGAYALNELMRDIFPVKDVSHSFKTIYELADSLREGTTLFVLADGFSPGTEDAEALLKHVEKGADAFISAKYFYGIFADTLKLESYDAFFKFGGVQDSSTLHFVSSAFDTTRRYVYRKNNTNNYFSHFDTTRTTAIAANAYNVPVTLRMRWGRGNFYLNATPMMFTNYYLLSGDNHAFISSTLSYLSGSPVKWIQYYQRGRQEISTPLRFILGNEPLRWAYYMALFSILAFMIFEMKRRQRIIPVIRPLRNSTLDFVATIGDLYYQKSNHKTIADKKINYFLESLRTKHGLSATEFNEAFAAALAKKTDFAIEHCRRLIELITRIRQAKEVSSEQLIELSHILELYYSRNKQLSSGR